MPKKKRMPVGCGMTPSTTRLGRFIRQRRLELDLPQMALAELTGIPQPTISDVEIGTRTYVNQQTLEKLAATLACNPQDLQELIPVTADVKPTTALGQLIRSRREALGLSREDLASKMGTTPYVVKDLETSPHPSIGYDRAQRVAKSLALNVIDFGPYVRTRDNPTTSALGQLVRTHRKALMMSCPKLAKKLRVTPQFVHQIELGRIPLCRNDKMIQRLARVLKLDVRELQAVRPRRQRPPLAEFFRARRLELGLTQGQVSQRMQTKGNSLLSGIETGKIAAGIRLLRKLEQALDCQIPPELVPTA